MSEHKCAHREFWLLNHTVCSTCAIAPEPADQTRAEHAIEERGRVYDRCRCGWYGQLGDTHVADQTRAEVVLSERVENHWCLDCASHTCEHAHASYDDRDPAKCACRGCARPVLTTEERQSLHPHAGDWPGFYAAVERILAARDAEPEQYIQQLTASRDAAERQAEKAEAAVARGYAKADEWTEEGDDLIRNCYSGQDVFEGEQMKRCATDLRAALDGERP